jgi:hypothetical protein
MTATLIWGRGFRLEEARDGLGRVCQELVGVDGGSDGISWSSVQELQELTACHGIGIEAWPVYPGCEVESDVPLEDAARRSAELRCGLRSMDPRAISEDYWLRFIHRILEEGHTFFIMV